MKLPNRRTLLALFWAALVAVAVPAFAAPGSGRIQDARRLVVQRCISCHGESQAGGLDLRTQKAMLRKLPSGGAGAAIMDRVTGAKTPRMPPGEPLADAEIELIRAWTAGGMPDAVSDPGQAIHWSFRPVRDLPAGKPGAARLRPEMRRNEIDDYIFTRLAREKMRPSPEADRYTLIRRLSFDLRGLPPSQAEIAAFVGDRSPEAYEKLVDRFLASPRYGERWAQHWLDLVRFAETNGFELDADRPQAWRYRDYVIDAFNADLPYDRFITEQIAGDLLDPNDFRLRTAAGFLRAGPRHVVGGNQDEAVNRQEWLTEAVSGIGSAVMGLTVQCARCHDHKFDPISQRDYYSLEAFLAGAEDAEFRKIDPEVEAAHKRAMALHASRLKPITDAIAEIEAPYRAALQQKKIDALEEPFRSAYFTPVEKRTPEQKRIATEAMALIRLSWDEVVGALPEEPRRRRAALRRRMHDLQLRAPEPLPFAPSVREREGEAPVTHLLVRGEVHAKGDVVPPAVPAVLASAAPGAPPGRPRRVALAAWLTDGRNPLPARVMVNRIWQRCFGHGLVRTLNDFGSNGEPPTHPELLDRLATRFVQGGWRIKPLLKTILLSHTYRQTSAASPDALARDPENRLLQHQNLRRLDAEAIRDAALAASGLLNIRMKGPSIRVPLEPEIYETIFTEGEPDNLWPVDPNPEQHLRRSIYLLRKRNVRLPLMAVFDAPDMMSPCGARGQSVHALQALTLMNSDFMQQISRALAQRLTREIQGDEQRVRRLFLLTAGRPPSSAESKAMLAFLSQQADAAAAWEDLALAGLNLNDQVYLR